MTDPHKVANSLTEAQRKWLPSFRAEWFGGYPIGMAKKTLRSLIETGLVDELRPVNFGPIKWKISPLGMAVRRILEEQNK